MNERKINPMDANIFRMLALLETTLRIQCEILAKLTDQKFEHLMEAALQEVQRDTKELIELHSSMGGDPTEN